MYRYHKPWISMCHRTSHPTEKQGQRQRAMNYVDGGIINQLGDTFHGPNIEFVSPCHELYRNTTSVHTVE